MATESLTSVPATGNAYLDSLIWGDKWNLSTGPITYDFRQGRYALNTLPQVSGIGESWMADEVVAVNRALSAWEKVCNISFRRDTSDNRPDIGFYVDRRYDFAGIAETPSSPTKDLNGCIFDWSHPSWWTQGALSPGGTGFETILHEIGHAIGLAHPHDHGGGSSVFPGVNNADDLGAHALNQNVWTIMSYISYSTHTPNVVSYTYGNVATPMALDIAAAQAIYGANMSYNKGDNRYVLSATNGPGARFWCVWDAGGSDTLSAAGSDKSATIDLRDAPLVGSHAGGYLSRINGVLAGCTIANGADIERAIGGNGNDRIIGNELANVLTGRAGNDTMFGQQGADLLIGGAGADILAGGLGNDTYVLDQSADRITGESVWDLGDRVKASFSLNLASMYDGRVEHATLTGSGEVTLIGNGADNKLTGNASDNLIAGSGGNDTLSGGGGSDSIKGGSGNDILIGGSGGDVMAGGNGHDSYRVDSRLDRVQELASQGTDTVMSSVSFVLPTQVENLVLLGASNIVGAGNGLGNVIAGNSAANVLLGNGGADRLYGGAGNDSIHVADSLFLMADGDSGADVLHFDYAGTIDLSDIDADPITVDRGKISGIEVLDFDNGQTNSLFADAADIIDINCVNTNVGGVVGLNNVLMFNGSAGDTLELAISDGWSAPDTTTLAGYAIYTAGTTRIAVDTDILVTLA